jgi:hypothetical protein
MPKGRSLIKAMFEVQVNILLKKGYDERFIQGDTTKGTFKERFRMEFDRIVREALWQDLTPYHFVVSMDGRFGTAEEKDRVEFLFLYTYDPSMKLDLMQVQTRLNETTKCYPVTNPSEIPFPEKAHKDLLAAQTKRQQLTPEQKGMTAKRKGLTP